MIKAKLIKKGEVLSEQQFYVVDHIVGDKIHVKNDAGQLITLNNQYAESCLTSAAQASNTKTVNKTEAANIFLGLSGVAITVNFNKQVKAVDVLKEIMDTHENTAPKLVEAAFKKAITRGLEGEERTMVGRHYGELNELGRVQFIDMEETKTPGKDYDTRLRLVDPRQLNWFIGKGVKYVVK